MKRRTVLILELIALACGITSIGLAIYASRHDIHPWHPIFIIGMSLLAVTTILLIVVTPSMARFQ